MTIINPFLSGVKDPTLPEQQIPPEMLSRLMEMPPEQRQMAAQMMGIPLSAIPQDPQQIQNSLLMQVSNLIGGPEGQRTPISFADAQRLPGFEHFARRAQEAGLNPEDIVNQRNANIRQFSEGSLAGRVGNFMDESGLGSLITRGTILAAGVGAGQAIFGGLGGGTTQGVVNNPGNVGTFAGEAAGGLSVPATGIPTQVAAGSGIPLAAGGTTVAPAVVGAGSGALSNFFSNLGSSIFQPGDTLGNIQRIAGLTGGLAGLTGPNDLTDLLGLTDQQSINAFRSADLNIPGGSLPGGITGGVDAQGNFVGDVGLFSGPFSNLLNQAGQPQVDPQVLDAFRSQIFSNLGTDFEGLRSREIARLDELARPGEDRLIQATRTDLQRRGRRGPNDSATGIAFEGLARGLDAARLQRIGQATDFASGEVNRAFQRAAASGQLLDSFRGTGLDRQLQALQGATNISQLPLPLQQLLLNMGIAGANARLGQATGIAQVNNQTSTPFDLFGNFLSAGGTNIFNQPKAVS